MVTVIFDNETKVRRIDTGFATWQFWVLDTKGNWCEMGTFTLTNANEFKQANVILSDTILKWLLCASAF